MIDIGKALEAAIEEAGGVRALGRRLNWKPQNISAVRAGEKISPFRAAQVAELLGISEEWAIIGALLQASKSHEESAFWQQRWERLYEAEAEKLLAELAKLEAAAKTHSPLSDGARGWDE